LEKKQIAVSGLSGKTKIYDIENGKELVTIKTRRSRHIVLGPEGKQLVVIKNQKKADIVD
jgi:hypothetical protein